MRRKLGVLSGILKSAPSWLADTPPYRSTRCGWVTGQSHRRLVAIRKWFGAPGRNRTGDLALRRRSLYPLSYGDAKRYSVASPVYTFSFRANSAPLGFPRGENRSLGKGCSLHWATGANAAAILPDRLRTPTLIKRVQLLRDEWSDLATLSFIRKLMDLRFPIRQRRSPQTVRQQSRVAERLQSGQAREKVSKLTSTLVTQVFSADWRAMMGTFRA